MSLNGFTRTGTPCVLQRFCKPSAGVVDPDPEELSGGSEVGSHDLEDALEIMLEEVILDWEVESPAPPVEPEPEQRDRSESHCCNLHSGCSCVQGELGRGGLIL